MVLRSSKSQILMRWIECERLETHAECRLNWMQTHFAIHALGSCFNAFYFWSNVSIPRSRQPPVASTTTPQIYNNSTTWNFVDAVGLCVSCCRIEIVRYGSGHKLASVYCCCTHMKGMEYCQANIKCSHFGIHPTSISDTLRLDFTSMVKQMHAASNHIDVDRTLTNNKHEWISWKEEKKKKNEQEKREATAHATTKKTTASTR